MASTTSSVQSMVRRSTRKADKNMETAVANPVPDSQQASKEKEAAKKNQPASKNKDPVTAEHIAAEEEEEEVTSEGKSQGTEVVSTERPEAETSETADGNEDGVQEGNGEDDGDGEEDEELKKKREENEALNKKALEEQENNPQWPLKRKTEKVEGAAHLDPQSAKRLNECKKELVELHPSLFDIDGNVLCNYRALLDEKCAEFLRLRSCMSDGWASHSLGAFVYSRNEAGEIKTNEKGEKLFCAPDGQHRTYCQVCYLFTLPALSITFFSCNLHFYTHYIVSSMARGSARF